MGLTVLYAQVKKVEHGLWACGAVRKGGAS